VVRISNGRRMKWTTMTARETPPLPWTILVLILILATLTPILPTLILNDSFEIHREEGAKAEINEQKRKATLGNRFESRMRTGIPTVMITAAAPTNSNPLPVLLLLMPVLVLVTVTMRVGITSP
jgi:hypothetical protein